MLKINWREEIPETKAYAVGDVRRVIQSRANLLLKVPSVTHGLGAISTLEPKDSGEGIVFRDFTFTTLPDENAGINVNQSNSSNDTLTPFFVGWKGKPAGNLKVSEQKGITLYEIYKSALEQAKDFFYSDNYFPTVFLEIIGCFRPKEIHDRALMFPVDKGNVLTTSDKYANKYYRKNIISEDMKKRKLSLTKPIVLCLSGVGFDLNFASETTDVFKQKIFYTPPSNSNIKSPEKKKQFITHSHAFGWRSQTNVTSDFDDLNLFSLMPPDYIVHIDDWSLLIQGEINIFIVSSKLLTFE